jgi:Ca-activated chloride channel family protein
MMLRNIEFANPEFFLLLLLIIPATVWYLTRRSRSRPEVLIPSTEALEGVPGSWRLRFYHSMFVLRMLAIAALSVALARPQTSSRSQDVTIEGIDIIICMDVSTSMLAEDFKPNRLEAAKDVAAEFIGGRQSDRMGLVIFSGESFTQCPLTTDHGMLLDLFDDIKTGLIDDGTAIGDGLATAVSRLRESKAVSKVVILLTDGENNMGSLDPRSAAEIAQTFGIRLYTIGVGSQGTAPYPFQTPFGIQYQNVEVKIDEPLLREMAQLTNGKYFRATSKQKLVEIYHQIDQMEKSRIDVTEFSKKHEEFLPLALAALILLLLEAFLRFTVFRTIP